MARAAFFLAVEKPERILFETGLTIAAKLVKARREIFFQSPVIRGAARGTADGIDMQFYVQPQFFKSESAREITSASVSAPLAPNTSTPN